MVLSLGMFSGYAQNIQKGWSESKNIDTNFKAVAASPDIEVFSAPNIIKLKVNQPVEIRVFSILGKLLNSQHLDSGIYEYHVEAHGIYLIKTEQSSCKVAV